MTDTANYPLYATCGEPTGLVFRHLGGGSYHIDNGAWGIEVGPGLVGGLAVTETSVPELAGKLMYAATRAQYEESVGSYGVSHESAIAEVEEAGKPERGWITEGDDEPSF